MKPALLLTLFIASLPAHAEKFKLEPPTAGVPDHLKDNWQFIGSCKQNSNWSKVEGSAQAKSFLNAAARVFQQKLPVYSCFRSQISQDQIRREKNCKPFGPNECSGVAAELSEHTIGAAADYQILTGVPAGASNGVKDAEIRKTCLQLDQIRRQFAGGRGGITVYGIGPDSVAFLHYDAKADWCNWGGCEKIGANAVLGEGHCKRKKFRLKEARLEEGLAAARELRSQAEIKRLEAELKRMRADCPPGDKKCQDSYKD